MDEKQARFIQNLERFIQETEELKQFKGKAKVLRSLERIRVLKTFN